MGGKALKITGANFDVEVSKSEVLVLLDFWATWCGPCMAIGPTIEKLAEEYAGRVKVGKVNVDDDPELASQFGITGIPAVLLLKNGRMVDMIVGSRSKADYDKFIKPHLT